MATKKDKWTIYVKEGKEFNTTKEISLPLDNGQPSSSMVLSEPSVSLLSPLPILNSVS